MENINQHKETFLAKWLAGEITDEELKSLVNEQDFHAYLKLRKALDINEKLDAPIEESFSRIKERRKDNRGKVIPLNLKFAIGIAASFIAMFVVFNFFKSNQVVMETNFGEQKSVVLKDGSEVILNSKSTISYNQDNWGNNRTLTLSGEAYFKVAKGKTFSVITENGTVEVLGTQFNVNSTEAFFDVICFEGKVRVTTNDSQDHILTPQKGIRKINGDDTLPRMANTNQPTWISGESTFESVPLYYVIQTLENEFQVQFESENINTELLYTGAFPNDNLEIALQTVFNPLDISYEFITQSSLKLRNNK